MRLPLFILFLWGSWGLSSAQTAPLNTEKFVRTLKGSALLVRLPDYRLALQALRQRGDSAGVEDLLRQRALAHKEILLSFTHTFDFCPVYFFSSRHSDAVRAGQLAGILRDREGRLIAPDAIPQAYYTAEFGATPKLQIEGFIVMDDQLLPLGEPLPFYYREYAWFGLKKRSKAEMLAGYNRQLWKIWEYYR